MSRNPHFRGVLLFQGCPVISCPDYRQTARRSRNRLEEKEGMGETDICLGFVAQWLVYWVFQSQILVSIDPRRKSGVSHYLFCLFCMSVST